MVRTEPLPPRWWQGLVVSRTSVVLLQRLPIDVPDEHLTKSELPDRALDLPSVAHDDDRQPLRIDVLPRHALHIGLCDVLDLLDVAVVEIERQSVHRQRRELVRDVTGRLEETRELELQEAFGPL